VAAATPEANLGWHRPPPKASGVVVPPSAPYMGWPASQPVKGLVFFVFVLFFIFFKKIKNKINGFFLENKYFFPSHFF
jgi:hypothetical protein